MAVVLYRELQDREESAREHSVPVALQYLYGGSAVVQGENSVKIQVN